MPQWTAQQQAAIEARNPTLLISAAAGSGKTAVLVERIMSLLSEGASLDRMLIVTFTRAAAAEMRQRLHRRLCEACAADASWARQLDLLPQAQISTIHGFCQTVLRSEFQAAGIDPLFRICTGATGAVLYQQAMEEAMNDLCMQGEAADFQLLMESFSQEEIFSLCTELEHFLMSLPHPFEWLEEKTEAIVPQGALVDHPWYREIVHHARLDVQGLLGGLAGMQTLLTEGCALSEYRALWEKDRETLLALMKLSEAELQDGLHRVSFVRAPSVRGLNGEEKAWKERYMARRNDLKKRVQVLCERLTAPGEREKQELQQIQRLVRGLGAMTRETHRRFQEKKRRRTLLDFSDLEQMTLSVLEQPDVCQRAQQAYDHIFVDECQDVSAIQDAILQRMHGEKNYLFMVGDVKQSIYRFRLAEPTIFLGRMKSYGTAAAAPERRISLQMNFRSDPQVLDAVNDVFYQLMTADATELDYTQEEALIPPPDREAGAKAELHLLELFAEPDEEESEQTFLSGVEAEAAQCAEEILRLHRGEGGKAYAFRDMVILMPKVRNLGEQVAEILEARGIPVYCDMKGGYFDLPEIHAMLSLLQVLDDPLQDIPLLSVLKLPGFHLTDVELADIRLCRTGRQVPFHEAFRAMMQQESPLGQRCRDIWERLRDWRFRLSTQALSSFLWDLMQETGYYAAVGALAEGATRQANLRLLCQRVMEYEQTSDGSLQGFLQSAEEMRESGESRAATLLGEDEDLLRIMTIHKSKGLEFPVVFVLGMEQKLLQAARGNLRCHPRLGVLLPYVNPGLRIKRATFGQEAFRLCRQGEDMAERARLLYVAMTRAKERLILFGAVKKAEQSVWGLTRGAYRIWEGRSMLDWVMQILLDDPALRGEYQQACTVPLSLPAFEKDLSTDRSQPAKHWKIRVFPQYSPQDVENKKVINRVIPQLDAWISTQPGEKLWKRWADMYQQREGLPLKTSVVSLVRQYQAQERALDAPTEETAEGKRQPEPLAPLRMETLPPLPAFLREEQELAVNRGTVVHKALSLIALDRLRALPQEEWTQELAAQKEAWLQQQLFTPKEGAMISSQMLLSFFHAPLGKRLLASPEVRREWSFNYRMPDAAQTLLQGVMDCVFREEDGWVLLDYKTDRITEEETFVQQYTHQLQLYARALGAITGLPVREAWLFSLSRGTAFPVPLP